MKVNISDTICAIATAPGGALGVIRMSGEGTLSVLRKVFRCREFSDKPETHRVFYGFIVSEAIEDEAVVTLMLAPRSYTREDVAEIGCHGGTVSVQRVLELLLKNGARLAENGEFTKRAFLNGRIDLSKAEAVCDIINAESELARKMALNQLSGFVYGEISALRDKLMRCFASIDAAIDYPENDIEQETEDGLKALISSMLDETSKLIGSADKGEIIKEGVDTVILGRPNVGKSSLMNALLRCDRSIVTDIAGTTRDVVREYMRLASGLTLRLSDTAGIRAVSDRVESMGVERSINAAKQAGLLLIVLDGSEKLSKEDIEVLNFATGKKAVVIVNKSDKPAELDDDEVTAHSGQAEIIRISAETGFGLNILDKAITKVILGGEIDDNPKYIYNRRHKAALIKAENSLKSALETLNRGMGSDLAVIDLEDAYRSLGEITGNSIDEDICDRIFGEFCLGK